MNTSKLNKSNQNNYQLQFKLQFLELVRLAFQLYLTFLLNQNLSRLFLKLLMLLDATTESGTILL